jgi:hypothetical protein
MDGEEAGVTKSPAGIQHGRNSQMNSISKTNGVRKPGRAAAGLGRAGLVVLLGIALSVVPGCKDATTPDVTVGSILVYNYSGATVDIYMDGVFRTQIAANSYDSIDDIIPGSRDVEAFLEGTQTLVSEKTIEVEAGLQYTFYVYGGATILVTNQFGEILKIYMDDTYVGDIGNNISQSIYLVPFGTRVLVAKKRSDDTEVATISIDVQELIEYTWVIVP